MSETPKFVTIPGWTLLTGQSRTSIYASLAKKNELRAIKLGKRTLIDVDHGLAWLRSLPQAKFGPSA
jgi:predicted DNA-binding transcriptional regulator AlpA